MKINESKEKLPLDFLTSTVSHGWEEIGNLKASIEGIKKSFSGTEKVEKILQELVDSYLICVGQLEMFLDKKNYIDMPEDSELKEAYNSKSDFILKESNEEDAEPFTAKKFEDNNKTEIFTDLPDYHVEVEQKGDKIEIELDPNKAQKDEIKIADDEYTFPDVQTNNDVNEPSEYFVDFDEPEPNTGADNTILEWFSRNRQ